MNRPDYFSPRDGNAGFEPEFSPLAPPPPPRASRRAGSYSWLWWFLAGTTVLAAAIVVGFFLLGMRAGQDQLDRARAQQINISLERAAQHVAADNLAAALADYQMVLQIDPDNEEALAWNEQLTQALGGAVVPAVEAIRDDGAAAGAASPLDALWADGQAAYANAEWPHVIALLEQIRVQDAAYRPDRVVDTLYAAHRNLGLDAEQDGRLAEALAHWDDALALRPDAADLQTLHTTIADYLDVSARYGDNWAETVADLRAFNERQPGYRDVSTQLQAALVALGDEQVDAAQWCAAAQSYAEAAELAVTPGIIFTRDQARERCQSGRR